MGYETTTGLPYGQFLPFQGAGVVNGDPVNRSNAGYKTLGGFIDSSDSDNDGLVGYWGFVVSSDPAGDPGALVIGQPAGYIPRGVLKFNGGVAENEPAKADYTFQDVPTTVVYEGTVRYQSWTNTQTLSRAVGAVELGDLIIFRALSTGTGAAKIGQIEFLPSGTSVPTGWAAFPGYVVEVNDAQGVAIEMSFDSALNASLVAGGVATAFALAGQPFRRTVTLTSAAAVTPINILTDGEVGSGKKAYVTNVLGKVNGATVWATTATVVVEDTAGVDGVTYAVAGMTANALLGLTSANVTVAAPVSTGVGFTTAKGLQIAGNANGTGSDFIVTVTGFIA